MIHKIIPLPLVLLLVLAVLPLTAAERPDSLTGQDLSSWRQPHGDWQVVGDVKMGGEGDRFLLPSALFFASGSATLSERGKDELNKLAQTLNEISGAIPNDIDWILRVDGHTDQLPIHTPRFPSNWELSTARAVSVVRYLAEQGIPPERMAAAGFGEFHPIDPGQSEAAYQRNRRIELKLTGR